MCNFPTIFSKIISTNFNPSLYGVFWLNRNLVLLCGTYFPTKKQVCGGGLENVCESAVIVT